MKKLFGILICLIAAQSIRAAGQVESFEDLDEMPSSVLMEEGREYFEKREAAKALSRFLIVGQRNQDQGNREQQELSIRALNNVGCVYKYFYYDYPQAYEYFNSAYQLCTEIGYDSFLPVILVNLGDLLCDYGMIYNSPTVLEEAVGLFNDCFERSIKDKNWELLTTSFFNLSSLDYDIDLSKYDGIFSKAIPPDTPDIEFVRLQYKGIKTLQEGHYDSAREYFMKQLEAVNTHWEPSRDSICAYMNIAETYRREENFKQETHYLDLALQKADVSGIIDLEAEIARQLADCFKALGDTSQYLNYHTQYLEKREEMHNARLANIGELKYISDLRKEEAKAQQATIRNRYLKFITITLGCVLIFIIISSFLIWRNNQELKDKNQSLFEKYRLLLEADEGKKEEKYLRSKLDDSKKEELIRRIDEIMNDPEQICRGDFTSKELAQLVDSNTTYVSQVINESYGISFSTLLGNSRIKFICHRIIEDPQYDKLTIEAMANSVGFKSRTAFINAFKREVGLTPSQYIKMAVAERNTKTP